MINNRFNVVYHLLGLVKLIITVSGRAMSGKSRLSFLLKKFLRENGFDVKHEVSLDYQNENQFERQMSKNFDEVIGQMKEQREILIKEEQLKRDYF
jgi:tRNA uridine 5-carbamoylmethylation protein Kti12